MSKLAQFSGMNSIFV